MHSEKSASRALETEESPVFVGWIDSYYCTAQTELVSNVTISIWLLKAQQLSTEQCPYFYQTFWQNASISRSFDRRKSRNDTPRYSHVCQRLSNTK